MTDTELIDAIEKHGISLWPDRESRTNIDSRVSEWHVFLHNPKDKYNPIQVTRASLRAALVDTLEKLQA